MGVSERLQYARQRAIAGFDGVVDGLGEALGLDIIGVFHSHPDHPDRPSEYDREWAQPFFSYVITSVQAGKAVESRSWRLAEDRTQFLEESIEVTL